jgi:hypothetical protein
MMSKPKKTNKPEKKPLVPYTWFKWTKHSYTNDELTEGRTYLFIGWITNAYEYSHNAVIMDDRGIITTHLNEEHAEVL